MMHNAQTPVAGYLFYAVIGLLFMCISGCAGPRFQQDYRPETDFSNLQTYSWRKLSSTLPLLDQHTLQQLADHHLAHQGFIKVSEEADMLLDLTLLTQTKTDSSSGIGISIGVPVGRSGSIGLGGGRSIPNTTQEGVLLLDITRRSDNTLIWRGMGEGIPMKHLSPQESEKLNAALQKLLAQFPPQHQQ